MGQNKVLDEYVKAIESLQKASIALKRVAVLRKDLREKPSEAFTEHQARIRKIDEVQVQLLAIANELEKQSAPIV
jgi:hypothetical protein